MRSDSIKNQDRLFQAENSHDHATLKVFVKEKLGTVCDGNLVCLSKGLYEDKKNSNMLASIVKCDDRPFILYQLSRRLYHLKRLNLRREHSPLSMASILS